MHTKIVQGCNKLKKCRVYVINRQVGNFIKWTANKLFNPARFKKPRLLDALRKTPPKAYRATNVPVSMKV